MSLPVWLLRSKLESPAGMLYYSLNCRAICPASTSGFYKPHLLNHSSAGDHGGQPQGVLCFHTADRLCSLTFPGITTWFHSPSPAPFAILGFPSSLARALLSKVAGHMLTPLASLSMLLCQSGHMSLSELLIRTPPQSLYLLGAEFYWKSTHGVLELKATLNGAPRVGKSLESHHGLCFPQKA